MAVDPQGHANLAEIGIQIRNATQFPYKPGNSGGAFDPAGDFYLRLDATSVKAREGIGSGDWSDITGRAGLYADAGAYSWAPAGDHRIHAVVRVKLPAQPPAGADWQLQGYTLDK